MNKLFVGDKGLYSVVTILFLVSLVAVFSTLPYKEIVGESGFFMPLFKRFVFLLIGLGIILIIGRIDYQGKFFKLSSLLIFIISIVFGIVLIINGLESDQAKRDLVLFGFTFQPLEVLKVTTILYLSFMLVKGYDLINNSFNYFALYVGIPIIIILGIVVSQKVSSAMLIAIISIIMLFFIKINWKYIFGLFAVLLVCGLIVFLVNTGSRAANTGNKRIEDFVESVFSKDKAANLQLDNPVVAIGNGGLFGTFPGNSKVKYYLKNSENDYIFSILVEEGGLVCGFVIIAVYILFLLRVTVIALRSNNKYGKMLAFGMGFFIVLQAFVHICVAVGLVPQTGEQLPLVSRGTTSLLTFCAMIGVIQSVASHNVIKMGEETNDVE